jgi:hypothetical protein
MLGGFKEMSSLSDNLPSLTKPGPGVRTALHCQRELLQSNWRGRNRNSEQFPFRLWVSPAWREPYGCHRYKWPYFLSDKVEFPTCPCVGWGPHFVTCSSRQLGRSHQNTRPLPAKLCWELQGIPGFNHCVGHPVPRDHTLSSCLQLPWRTPPAFGNLEMLNFLLPYFIVISRTLILLLMSTWYGPKGWLK